MRMKESSNNPHTVATSTDQKRSVFERLGGQLDKPEPMKRKPSPGKHGEYMQLPPMQDPEFTRFGLESLSQAEMNWRFQNDRRYMSPMFSRDRHPMQLGPPPLQPPPPPMPHYEMEMVERGQHTYYMRSMSPYHNAPPGPSHPVMGTGNMPMNVNHLQSSPKYDRHGNPIVNVKDRPDCSRSRPNGPSHHGMSPPGHFMPEMMMPGIQPMVHPDMPPMRPRQMYPHYGRWAESGMEPDFPPYEAGGRMHPDDRFSSPNARRYPQPPLMGSPPLQMQHPQVPPTNIGDFPRYARWRERRDVITSLDRETAQSSSRTDSLRSSLQQQDMRPADRRESRSSNKEVKKPKLPKESKEKNLKTSDTTTSDGKPQKGLQDSSTSSKTDPQDISDGEIVDDEDSSDESEITRDSDRASEYMNGNYISHSKNMIAPYHRPRESQQYYEKNKKRRLHERDDYSLDYETISDDDLDIYMGDKKDTISIDEDKSRTSKDSEGTKVSSEIELLDTLGLDWANLVEMAKQSRNSNKANVIPGAALKRFSLTNYIPSLSIDPKLAGPELYELIQLRLSKPLA